MNKRVGTLYFYKPSYPHMDTPEHRQPSAKKNRYALTALQQELLEGLTAPVKYISPKFFYDTEGTRIFREIMHMPEYYLTDCETEIFETHKQSLSSLFCNGCRKLELVELGAGDGQKTRILLGSLVSRNVDFRYIPVDISREALSQLEATVDSEFPGLQVDSFHGDYFHLLEGLSRHFRNRKVVLFLGSNLGNFSRRESIDFLQQLSSSMSENDLLCIGLDLKKEPDVILPAYDDPHGYTRAFNMNLLSRANRELGGDFREENFIHKAVYDQTSGAAKSYLVSRMDQQVTFSVPGETVPFREGETIFTERSQKYDLELIRELSERTGFQVVRHFMDSREYFVDSIWQKTGGGGNS